MSMLATFIAWLRSLAPCAAEPQNPDQMCLRDWADLPVHHPRCD